MESGFEIQHHGRIQPSSLCLGADDHRVPAAQDRLPISGRLELHLTLSSLFPLYPSNPRKLALCTMRITIGKVTLRLDRGFNPRLKPFVQLILFSNVSFSFVLSYCNKRKNTCHTKAPLPMSSTLFLSRLPPSR